MMNDTQRDEVIAEALTWERTPHHNGACVKGHGVDCGTFPIAVYSKFGLMPKIEIPRYSPQFHLHKDVEWYKTIVEQHGQLIDKPRRGDFALYKVGRIYSHGAIVIEWPHIIHAWIKIGVVRDLGDQGHLADKDVLFYCPGKTE